MKIRRKDLLAAIAAGAGLFLGGGAATAQQDSPTPSPRQITQIVASPDRKSVV